ncbi:MAG: Mpo1-like protein [Woeseiaceae bacterium]|nr:Mpo1-like protein [Woeseiaceae bacterium]
MTRHFVTADTRLMDMLTGYASAHQHPFNIAVHLVGIPVIMLGVFIALSWVSFEIGGVTLNFAYLATLGLFVFYTLLDRLFGFVFLVYAVPIAWLATRIGAQPLAVSGTVAAAAFFGGYLAQFAGHAVEKSVPVVLKHPVQANFAAPFFIVVEIFSLLGLRDELFREVQRRIDELRQEQAA